MKRYFIFSAVVWVLPFLLGCSGTDSGKIEPQNLAVKMGLTQYVGKITPIEFSKEGDVTTYTFDKAQGPKCMRGDDYKASVRDLGSENLLIFLQGGGACWSAFCLAVTKAPEGMPGVDIVDRENSANPVANWNVLYLPYCDASFFAGDAEIDDNINDLGPRYHYGLANFTGAMEAARLRFPSPKRILLAGSSGGAYGLLFAGPLVRHYYPQAELMLLADSGAGIAKEGNVAYTNVLLDEFNLARFIPSDCDDCMDGGHMTGMISYFLARDPAVKFGLFSSWYDGIIGSVFLQIPGAQYSDSLKNQTDKIAAAFPGRFKRFIIDGNMHTTLLGDPSGIVGSDLFAVELPPGGVDKLMKGINIGKLKETKAGDKYFSAWFKALIDGDDTNWTDVLQERGTPPAK